MIGARLREERNRLGFNQTESGELCGVKKNTVLFWEKDETSIPADKLALLGEQGFDVLYIVTGVRTPEREIESDLNPKTRRFVDAVADRIIDRLLKNKIIKTRDD